MSHAPPPLSDRSGSVRRAEDRDLDRLTSLWIAIGAHHEPLDPLFRMRPGADADVRSLLRRLLRDRDTGIFVYESQGDLSGLCLVRILRAPPILEEVERGEITDLGVSRDRRRQGIGSALVESAIEWLVARDVRRIEVRVAVANREGQAFWRARGFYDLMDVLQKRL